jgi:hypothetical protein
LVTAIYFIFGQEKNYDIDLLYAASGLHRVVISKVNMNEENFDIVLSPK